MPDFSIHKKAQAPGAFDRAMVFQPADKRESSRVAFEGAQITPYAMDWLGAHLDPDAGKVLDVDTLNERYGVDGYVSFAKPRTQGEADYRSRAGARAAWRDSVLAASPLSGAESLWQGLKGGALDPIAIPTYFIGIGEGVKGGQALGEGAVAFGRGRLVASAMARGVAENTIGGIALEGFNYGLKNAAGEDYNLGQSFDNLPVGALMGAGFGAIGGHFQASRAARAGRAMDAGAAFDALIDTESRGRQFGKDGQPLTSPKGAIGIAQVMPGTAPEAAKLAGLAWDEGRYKTDAEYNKALGKAYFLKQVDTFGDTDKAWAAYNAGPGAVKKAIKAHGADWLEHLPAETKAYVERNRGIVGAVAVPTAPRVGGGTELLSPAEKAGTFEQAFDQLLDDSPVDISGLMPAAGRELKRAEVAGFHVEIPARVYHDDMAVTTSGWEVPVRYAVVDIKDLRTSHDGDLNVNADYPAELQPRQRDRAGSAAYNRALETKLNPRRLLSDVAAESGAPIVGKDGVVESGNGRTIALRRSAEAGGDTYARYKAAIEGAGYDTRGIEHPALVRVNAADMSHGDRIRWTRDANPETSERMGVAEQSRVDAERLPNEALALIDGPDFSSAGNRGFVRSFIKHVAPDALNSMSDAAGNVSAEAVRRVKAALLSKAYDNPRLVERLFEDADPNIKSIGRALQDAAPGWAKLKALVALGRIAPEADLSTDLSRALDLVMEGRDGLRPLRDLIDERIDQVDMLSGDAMSEAQIAFLRVLFKDADFKVGRSVEDMTRAMDAYTSRAAEVSDGVDLFGNSVHSQVRDSLQASVHVLDEGITVGDKRVFTFRSNADKTHGAFVEALAPGRDAGGDGGSSAGAGGAKPKDGPAGAGPAPRDPGLAAQKLIASDPELMALREDIDLFDPAGEYKPTDLENPETLAEVGRALALCMIEGGVK